MQTRLFCGKVKTMSLKIKILITLVSLAVSAAVFLVLKGLPENAIPQVIEDSKVGTINTTQKPVITPVTTSTTAISDKSNSLFEKVTITEYNGVGVDVLIDNETLNKVNKQQPVNVIVAYRGSTVDPSKILEDSGNFIGRVKKILPAGNNIIVSVVYPEGEKIAGGNIKDAEAGLLWVKNRISNHLGITLGKVLLVGHSQGAYLVTILNTLQQTDGIFANSPGPLNLKLLCERMENGAYANKYSIGTFTCDTFKKQYGSVKVNPEPYVERSLLLSFISGYKAKTLFTQGMKQTGIQIELWPLFKKSVQSCSNCAKVEFLDVPNGEHTAGFEVPDAIAKEKAFLAECIKATPTSPVLVPATPVSSADTSKSIEQKISAQVLPFIDTTGKSSGKAPGMVVGVIKKDFTGTFGFGTKVINTNQKPDGNSFYGIGSVSKVFTGLILADEVSKGSINLDKSVIDFMQGTLKTLLSSSLTFRNLVSHTSGLKTMPDNVSAPRVSGGDGYVWWSPARNYEREDLARCLQRKGCAPDSSKVGTYVYSNLGIGVLGMALQDKLGFGSFDEMLKARITTPLGMIDTGTNVPDFINKTSTRSVPGYDVNAGVLTATPYADMGATASAGEIITTANDMLKFMAVLTGLNTSTLVQASSLAMTPLATIDSVKKVGYAITMKDLDTNSPTYFKAGGTHGFSAFIIWKRNPKIGIVILSNKVGLDSSVLSTLAESLLNNLK